MSDLQTATILQISTSEEMLNLAGDEAYQNMIAEADAQVKLIAETKMKSIENQHQSMTELVKKHIPEAAYQFIDYQYGSREHDMPMDGPNVWRYLVGIAIPGAAEFALDIWCDFLTSRWIIGEKPRFVVYIDNVAQFETNNFYLMLGWAREYWREAHHAQN